jgi:hypothetical protein
MPPHDRTSTRPSPDVVPRQVLLFSGHRVDAPGRPQPRFPPGKVADAARRIDEALAHWQAGPQDLAITQGAAGGDLLFAHACQQRGVPLQLMLPMPEAEFVRRAVAPSAEAARWRAAWSHVRARLSAAPRVLPAAAGNPFERCNRWMLDTALGFGVSRLRLICLWDGGGGDGPGGTDHLVEQARSAGVPVTWIDTRRLRSVNGA